MIINFKIFEHADLKVPKKGCFVICKINHPYLSNSSKINEILSNEIGKIVWLDNKYTSTNKIYGIKYNNPSHVYGLAKELIPYFDSNNVRSFNIDEILHWSIKKEDLEAIINSKKFGL